MVSLMRTIVTEIGDNLTFHNLSFGPEISGMLPQHQDVDEPHGFLFAYIHIFTLLVDDHMIVPHAIDLT